jgi:uncharacterized protein (DUF58 family)
MLSGAARGLEHWAARWALRRQGPDTLGIRLKRRRIYILPTRFGVIFGLLVFAMLLGSMNYGASLGFGLTFLLAGVGFVAMHHCHNNLLGTELRFLGANPVFAGQTAEFRIAIANETDAPRYEIELRRDRRETAPIDLPPRESRTLRVGVTAERRGWVELGRFVVATRHPGSLFRAWAWIHMDAKCLVYPQPARPGRPLPPGGDGPGARGRPESGDADFVGLRAATPADPPQRIAWKAYARTNELLLKQFSSGEGKPHTLDWDTLPELEPEARLAQLARWCLDAASETRDFGLRLPGITVPLGSGQPHLHECLRALALFEHSAPGGTGRPRPSARSSQAAHGE